MAKSKGYKRILVIQPDHIGDVLLATPMIRSLRRRFPDAKIDILVGSWAEEMVAHNPDIDDVVVLNFNQFKRGRQSDPEKWHTFFQVRSAKYDLAVMARSRNRLIRLFAWVTGIPERIGFAVPGKDRFLTIKIKQKNPREHVVLRNLRIAEALGANIDSPELVLHTTKEAQAWAEKIVSTLPRPLIGINPGAGTEAKRWPADRFNELALNLQNKYKGSLIITGGPNEVELARQVATGITPAPIITAGESSLLELAALGEKLDLFISNDSGPMHMVAAMKTPVIDLHSGTDYPSMWRPWGEQHTVLTYAEECDKLPCFKTECDYFEHGCLEKIKVGDVMEAVGKYL